MNLNKYIVIKEDVSLVGIQYEMRKATIAYFAACDHYKILGEITSGTEGIHGIRSYHYYGYALDFSINGMTREIAVLIEQRLRTQLGSLYDVVLENDHIHVEFDVERAKRAGYKKEF